MNEKEKKAIEELSKKAVFCNYEERDYPNMICFKKDMLIVLNLIEKLQKENEEKNKIIDSMIKVMIENSICDYFIKEKCKNYAGENGKTCDECIKQYFENKVKEVK